MNSIITNLSDPSWWFTAFFIAIVASVIAGFLKDKIEKCLGSTFSGLRKWREDKKAQRNKIIEAMLSNPMYFTIALFITLLKFVCVGTMTTLYMTFPILIANMPHSSLMMVIDFDFFVWKILHPISGVLTVVITYKTSVTTSLVSEACREFRKRNNLPKLL